MDLLQILAIIVFILILFSLTVSIITIIKSRGLNDKMDQLERDIGERDLVILKSTREIKIANDRVEILSSVLVDNKIEIPAEDDGIDEPIDERDPRDIENDVNIDAIYEDNAGENSDQDEPEIDTDLSVSENETLSDKESNTPDSSDSGEEEVSEAIVVTDEEEDDAIEEEVKGEAMAKADAGSNGSANKENKKDESRGDLSDEDLLNEYLSEGDK